MYGYSSPRPFLCSPQFARGQNSANTCIYQCETLASHATFRKWNFQGGRVVWKKSPLWLNQLTVMISGTSWKSGVSCRWIPLLGWSNESIRRRKGATLSPANMQGLTKPLAWLWASCTSVLLAWGYFELAQSSVKGKWATKCFDHACPSGKWPMKSACPRGKSTSPRQSNNTFWLSLPTGSPFCFLGKQRAWKNWGEL